MKKILFTLFLINSIISFAEKRIIYIQYYPNPQIKRQFFFSDDCCRYRYLRNACCCIFCCFNYEKTESNNLEHKCVIEIDDQEESELDLTSKIEKKLLDDRFFLANYGQLHFYVNGKEIKDGNFDLKKVNVIVVKQK